MGPGRWDTLGLVRLEWAAPAAERSAKGEGSSLSEPCAGLTIPQNGVGGRPILQGEGSLRLCVFAPLRFCLVISTF